MSKIKETWIIIAGMLSYFLIISLLFVIFFFPFYYVVIVFICSKFVEVILSFYLLNSKKLVNIKLSWIFVILGIPFFGFLIFFIFGINPLLKKKRVQYIKRQFDFSQYEDFSETLKFIETRDKNLANLINYNYLTGLKPYYEDNKLIFFKNQTDFFHETIKLVQSAKKFIHIQSYIFSNNSVFFKILISEIYKKAQEGVKVKIIYDWVGSHKRVSHFFWKHLASLSPNIEVAIFNPWRFTIFTSKTNFRCHRKCIIVDNEKVIYGGSNIADEYINYRPNTSVWLDLNYLVCGKIVNTFNLTFLLDWLYYCSKPLKSKKIFYKKNKNKFGNLLESAKFHTHNETNVVANEINNIGMQLTEASPDYDEKTIRDSLIYALGHAKKRIYIMTPYFIVSDDILNILRTCALSGVDVKLIMSGEVDDKKYILTVNRSNYQSLLNANVSIYEYKGFCHAKLIVVDDEIVCLGTINFDFRSFYINFESLIISISKDLNSFFSNYFMQIIKNCNQISFDSFSTKKWKKIKRRMSIMNVYHPLL